MTPRIMTSHHLCRLFGIEVRVAYFLYFFLGLVLVVKLSSTTTAGGALLVLSFVTWPAFVLAHELGHALVAVHEGMRVHRILLHVMGGVAEIRGLIPGPISEILVAMAGPCVNLVIAAVFFLPLLLLGRSDLAANALGQNGFLPTLLTFMLLINLSLAIFNFVPIFPMDGGRVATALAVMFLGPQRGTRLMGLVALAGTCLLVAAGLYVAFVQGRVRAGLVLALIGTFLYTTGKQELQARMFVARYRTTGAGSMAPFPGPVPSGQSMGFEDLEARPDADVEWLARWRRERRERREARRREEEERLRRQVDSILAKVKQEGIGSLTPRERQVLDDASAAYRRGKD